MEKIDLLASLPLFEGLSRAQLESLSRAAFESRYAAGELIFSAEAPTRGLFVVRDGHVKIFRSTLEGREQTIYLIGPGQPFCLAGALGHDPAPASAMALSRCTVLSFPSALLESLGREEPALLVNMILSLSARLKQAMAMIENLALKELPERLAAFVLVEAGAGQLAVLSVPHVEIAKVLGTTPETLSRTIKRLAAEGLLAQEGRNLRILDRPGLTRLAGLDC
ncbi:MAG: Fumarate and nitrate reduction regulatory protein [Deltaproteobacteria bacterium ADurb.Bin510]|nr:MAG: Fumarate and nitrate reduction regulatory protein [Deltaproteobacteria bacterium ADurb.Bin510]